MQSVISMALFDKNPNALLSCLSRGSFCTRLESDKFIDAICKLKNLELFIKDKTKLCIGK